MDRSFAVGVDLGGSHVSAGIVDTEGRLICRYEKSIKKSDSAENIILNDLFGLIKECLDKVDSDSKYVKGVGIGIPGRTDSKKGICVFAPNLRWKNVYIAEILKEKTPLPIFILNDVRAMAVGEKVFGNGKNVENFVCIAIGTGIGGGLVLNGQLVLGSSEGAGEIGHITIDINGPECGCGNRGCAETFASGPAIVARGVKILNRYPDSIMATEEFLSPKIIYEAALQNDEAALTIWKDTGTYLGRLVASIATTIDPQLVLFSGKVSRAIDFFLPGLKAELKARAKMIDSEKIMFARSKFEDEAGIVGNAARVFESLKLL